jgi:hypothetical protein
MKKINVVFLIISFLLLVFSCSEPSENHSFKSSKMSGGKSVKGLELNKTSTNVRPIETEQLTATVLPSTAENKNVKWESSDHTIAIVSQSGLITPKSYGTAVITATTIEGDFTATCSVTITYLVGQVGPAGGLIFYDKGNYNNGWRFFEAAPFDQNSNSDWAPDGYDSHLIWSEDRDDMSLGTGSTNTNLIVTYCNTSDSTKYAASYCTRFSYGGYSDWFLPSIYELNLMYANLKQQGLGGFSDDGYWSSTEDDHNAAYWQHFNNGNWYRDDKEDNLHVRAARCF